MTIRNSYLTQLTLVLAAGGMFGMGGLGCSADTGEGDDVECDRGEVLVGGRCVPNDRRDTGRDAGTDVGVDTTPEDVVDDSGDGCTPLETRCAPGGDVEECNAAGTEWTSFACAEGQYCDGGTCVLDTGDCTPGETFECENASSLRVCSADGSGTEIQACPPEAYICSSGECIVALCEPGLMSCDGADVVRCSNDGQQITVEETCSAGCEDGACVEGCAAGKTYVGCDFYAVDLDNDEDANAQQFAISVSNTTGASVDIIVTDAAGTEVATATVPGSDLRAINLPRNDVNGSGISDGSFHIAATGPVTIHQFNPANNSSVFSNDASLLLPTNAVGTDYLVMGWPTIGTVGNSRRTYVVIVATEDGTTVNVDAGNLGGVGGADGVPNIAAGGNATFTVNAGEVISLQTTETAGADLTGMSITSNNPVVVMSGGECQTVPVDNTYCDHIEEQLFPVDTWSTEYVAAKFQPRGSEPDVWRVMAAVDGTTITTTPSIPVLDGRTIGRGEMIEVVTAESFVITATNPISVGQFMVGSSYPGPSNGCDRNDPFGNSDGCAIPDHAPCGGSAIGDPAFLMSVPTSQFLTEYVVLTPGNYVQDYLTVVAPTGASIQLDGTGLAAASTTIPGTTWQMYRFSVPDGVHIVTGSMPFGLYAYGYDCDVSYAYPGGLNLE